MKGQVSFEYMLVVGLAMLLIISGVMLFYNYSTRSGDDVTASIINKIGNDIATTVEKVYYVGGDSWETVKFNVPSNVKNIYVLNPNELIIAYDSYGIVSEAIFFSDVNMTTPFAGGNISLEFHPGFNIIKIASQGTVVNISETS